MSIPGWLRVLAVNVALTVVLLVIALAAIEGYLRITIPPSSGGSIFEYTQSTNRYKVMKPNARIVAWGSEFRTNRLGFRDRKTDVDPKTPSEFRIIVLGDSFTVSAGVDFDRIYTSLLETRLKGRFPQSTVLNLAVGGYNIVQYQLVLEEVGRALEPDLVVVGVFPFNDLSDETYRRNLESATRETEQVALAWHRRLFVYQAYLSKVESRLRPWLAPRAVRASVSAPPPSTARHDNLSALKSIVDSVRAEGKPAVAVLLPNTDRLELQRSQFAPFETFCRDTAVPCLNLLDHFSAKNVDAQNLRLNVLDSHPNEAYHVLVADALAEYVAPLVEEALARRNETSKTPAGAVR
jgi:lysophospholipase L1-like esterase